MKKYKQYSKSKKMLKKSKKLIPLGSQTFSKSYIQFPENYSPSFIERGKGGRVWDIDGNEYIDLICGLMPVILGYCDVDVDNAIKNQLKKGISFSLASELEYILAKKLIKLIPSAEMVRFGKNGTDVTSAAVRVARGFTNREHILVCGYHGWQDWYIGTTNRSKGILRNVQKYTHKVPFNDIESIHRKLKELSNNVAALIIEPMNIQDPKPEFFNELKELLHKNKSLLIFDEIITGFRFSDGGAQKYFNILPDLSTFGKGMGNGMPISAIVGREEIMNEFQEIFFSSTFGGETLSLAASIATIEKIKKNRVPEKLYKNGFKLKKNIIKLLKNNNLHDTIQLNGHPSWTIFDFKDHQNGSKYAIKSLFIKSMIENNILISSSNNLCYAHNFKDYELINKSYKITFESISEKLRKPNLDKKLKFPVIRPIFAPR
tara:strand:- start:29534 stop:30829 length:1296 start_codon:yes stop_codon:yes gene_type:complete